MAAGESEVVDPVSGKLLLQRHNLRRRKEEKEVNTPRSFYATSSGGKTSFCAGEADQSNAVINKMCQKCSTPNGQ